jgi:hypothetical protein
MLPPRTISANGIEISVLEQGDGHWSCFVTVGRNCPIRGGIKSRRLPLPDFM